MKLGGSESGIGRVLLGILDFQAGAGDLFLDLCGVETGMGGTRRGGSYTLCARLCV